MSSRSLLSLLGALALGTGLTSACTPGSSHSSPPDTTAAATAPEASEDPSSRRPSAEPPTPDTESRSVSQRLADASVAARAKQALAQHRTLRRFDFSPSAVRGRLTLRGDVDTREQYREAERVVAALDAVRAVTNEVTVDGRPVADADPSSAGTAYHTVRRGDTLSEIARRYGVSVQQLRRLNDGTAALQPGQRLRVR